MRFFKCCRRKYKAIQHKTPFPSQKKVATLHSTSLQVLEVVTDLDSESTKSVIAPEIPDRQMPQLTNFSMSYVPLIMLGPIDLNQVKQTILLTTGDAGHYHTSITIITERNQVVMQFDFNCDRLPHVCVETLSKRQSVVRYEQATHTQLDQLEREVIEKHISIQNLPLYDYLNNFLDLHGVSDFLNDYDNLFKPYRHHIQLSTFPVHIDAVNRVALK